GPRQSARAILPTIITQLLSGKEEIKLGSLSPTRDLNFVKDICNGFAAIAKSEQAIGHEINICSGKEISMGDLAGTLISMINPEAVVISDDQRVRPEKSEVERLNGNNAKIKQLTGWSPAYTLEKGLDETIEWFRNKDNLKRYKPEIYNV
ncbi:MAG: GDP-mannose 4,6-dehydratase, partial [Nitrospiraceae bacterium]